MKIVINVCHGGFGLSEKAICDYAKRKNIQLYIEQTEPWGITTHYTVPPDKRVKDLPGNWMSNSLEDRAAYNKACREQRLDDKEIPRNDLDLVETIETLGSDEASGRFANLKVVEIPDDVEWTIDEYDGLEWVAEKHRTWN
jgi:hypothetical protein